MRTLPTGNGDAQWENSIIKDLSFIKKHLRYPFNKKTLVPSLMFGMFLAFIARFAWFGWIMARAANKHSFLGSTSFVVILVLTPLVISLAAYYRTLRFEAISTVFYMGENQQLIQKFLQSQHLVVYRHPEAPEVFQIISRNISATKNEEREVMIFIADDKRILINSHITGRKLGLGAYTSRNYKQMAKLLRTWMLTHVPDNTNTAIVSNNRF